MPGLSSRAGSRAWRSSMRSRCWQPVLTGMIEGFSLGNYLLLVEYTGRLFREGKALISGELAVIFKRLGSNAEKWQGGLEKPAAGPWLGRFFARPPGPRR